jgi:hypothetical protein
VFVVPIRPFAKRAGRDISADAMIAIRQLLSLLAVLGLILAPLGRPVMGATADVHTVDVHAAAMHAAMSDATAAPMAAGMPCCPDEAPASDCAKDCPLMALCMVGSILDFPAGITLPVPRSFTTLALAGNEPDIAGLTHGPPPRPPKI